jgi:hypothetical protein
MAALSFADGASDYCGAVTTASQTSAARKK